VLLLGAFTEWIFEKISKVFLLGIYILRQLFYIVYIFNLALGDIDIIKVSNLQALEKLTLFAHNACRVRVVYLRIPHTAGLFDQARQPCPSKAPAPYSRHT
jgi:hypothetical protein